MKDNPSEDNGDEAQRLAQFVRACRKQAGLTQYECAKRMGVGIRFLKELEAAKQTLRLDKVATVLHFFGATIKIVPMKKTPLWQDED